MEDIDRCNEEFWGARCDQPRGHRTAHSGRKAAARITWGNPTADPDRDASGIDDTQE